MQSTPSEHEQTAPTAPTIEGQVLWFKPLLGYGFLVFEGDQTIFFHRDCINAPIGYRHLAAGDYVTFELGTDFQGRPAAKHVTRSDDGGAK